MLVKIRTALILVAFVVVVAVAGWAVYEVVRVGRNSPVLPAFITGVLALGGVLIARVLQARETEQTARRALIAPLYREIIATFLNTDKAGGTAELWAGWTEQLILWGNPAVIHAWLGLRQAGVSAIGGPTTTEPVRLFEQFLRAAREDIGISNKNLSQGNLLRLYINDWDEAVATEVAAQSIGD
jgi:hypothetical protein